MVDADELSLLNRGERIKKEEVRRRRAVSVFWKTLCGEKSEAA
jgi:hypothetical protein